ncbi:MAG: hypothetical protein R3C39_00205 [Dehalococcoidia bacterium]
MTNWIPQPTSFTPADVPVWPFNRGNEEITDTVGIAHGQIQLFTSGSTIVLKVYDAEAAAWRSVTLS